MLESVKKIPFEPESMKLALKVWPLKIVVTYRAVWD